MNGSRFFVILLTVLLFLAIASGFAGASLRWCDWGTPPGLSGASKDHPAFVNTDRNDIDLHAVDPMVGYADVTGNTPARQRPGATDHPVFPQGN